MFVFKKAKKNYLNQQVFKELNLKLNSKGLYFLVGPSGSGKSTILNLMSFLDSNYQGSIKFNKKEIKNLSINQKEEYIASNLTYLFQDPKLIESETIKTNLEIASMRQLKNKQYKEYLNKVHLNKDLDFNVKNLSKGEKQRLTIALMLIRNNPIILLDEITSALDEENELEILKIIKEISKSSLVILVTHNEKIIKGNDAKILRIENKILNVEEGEDKLTKSIFKNNKLSFKYLLSRCKKLIFKKPLRSLSLIFSLSLSLVTIGLSTSLSQNVTSSIKDSLNSLIDRNNLIMSSKNDNSKISSRIVVDENEFDHFNEEYKDYLKSNYYYYQANFEDYFIDENYSYININNSYFNIDEIDVRSFSEFINLNTFNQYEVRPKLSSLDVNEIALGLTKNKLMILCKKLGINSNYEDEFSNYLLNHDLYLNLSLRNDNWEYDIILSFKIKAFFLCSKIMVGHFNPQFNEYVIENKMQLPYSYNLDLIDYYPWTVKKICAFEIKNNDLENLFKKYLYDELMNKYSFHLLNLDTKYYSHQSDYSLIYFTYKNDNSLNLSNLTYLEGIDNVLYYLPCSNETYDVIEGALLKGFSLPTYLSSSLVTIEEFIDINTFTEVNYGIYQASVFNSYSDDFYSLNYLDSTKESFIDYEIIGSKVDEGRLPNSKREIVISSSLKEKLKIDLDDESIYLTSLVNIYQDNDIYKNEFEIVEVVPVGVISSNELKIYQDEIFIYDYQYLKLKKDSKDISIDKVLIRLKDYELGYEDLKEIYPSYDFYSLVDEYDNKINDVIKYISLGLLVFSLIILISSFCLIILINYLFYEELRKEIATYIFFGYKKKSAISLFYLYDLILIFISMITSIISLIVTSIVMKNFTDLGDYFDISILGILIIFLISIISFIVSLTFLVRIYKDDPLMMIKEK